MMLKDLPESTSDIPEITPLKKWHSGRTALTPEQKGQSVTLTIKFSPKIESPSTSIFPRPDLNPFSTSVRNAFEESISWRFASIAMSVPYRWPISKRTESPSPLTLEYILSTRLLQVSEEGSSSTC